MAPAGNSTAVSATVDSLTETIVDGGPQDRKWTKASDRDGEGQKSGGETPLVVCKLSGV